MQAFEDGFLMGFRIAAAATPWSTTEARAACELALAQVEYLPAERAVRLRPVLAGEAEAAR